MKRLLAACLALSACALQEGKLTAAATRDAGPSPMSQRDAGRRPDAARESGRSGTGGAGDHAQEAGRSGSVDASTSSDAEDAGRSDAPKKAHGEACSASSDCASGNECIPTTADGNHGVCVDTSQCGSQNKCARDYWAATCQLDRLCSAQSFSFEQCYQVSCTRSPDSNALCTSQLSITKGLIASRCCPPGGAYHSSCDPAPHCGCQDGEKCDVIGTEGQTSCGPVGSGGELDACTRNRDCVAGLVCTNGGCTRYCDGPDDQRCAPTGACKPMTLLNVMTPGSFACSHTCDPTSPDTENGPFRACRSGQRCEPATDGYSDCFESGGAGRQGASCIMTANPVEQTCAPGFACFLGTLTCAKYCKVAAHDCEVGTCRSDLPNKKFAAGTEIGFCYESEP